VVKAEVDAVALKDQVGKGGSQEGVRALARMYPAVAGVVHPYSRRHLDFA